VLILPLEEAKEGMALAAPVPHPERPDQDLLKRGYVLEEKILRRLHELSIGFVYVEYPGLEELDRHLEVTLSPARRTIYQQIKNTLSASQQRTRPAVSYNDYYNSTREMVLTLLSQGQHPLYLDQMSRLGTDAVGHATAVAHLSLLLGIKLDQYLIEQRKRLAAGHAKEVVNLGVAGMLHDMGKLKLPPHLQRYNGAWLPEKPQDAAEWEQHAQLSYELIHDGVEPSAATAVLNHHQHYDGSGFPAAPAREGAPAARTGQDIHVFARIIAVADLYDRLSTHPTDQARRPNLEVFHLMRNQYEQWLDPVVFNMLQVIAPPFPPGMRVDLNDQTSGVITRVDPADPYRPVIKRFQSDGQTLEDSPLELRRQPDLQIRSIAGTEVTGLLPGPVAA
jgi:HD-GYP domain-containing protein (c-di-GMP phosphodiesterase class II)